ncbi:MAG: hypothetical protein WD598_03550 [Acidimicrobiia bacterium]
MGQRVGSAVRRPRMKRALVVGAIVVALVGTSPASGADVSGGPVDDIRAAYGRVLNESLPMSERLGAVEDGSNLRKTLRDFDALEEVVDIRFNSVQLAVDSARVHEGDAEVYLEVYVDYYMVTGWTGVAHKVDGSWVVARATICSLFLEWTPVRCPGSLKRTRSVHGPKAKTEVRGGDAVIPLTFTDGGRADLVVPSDLHPDRWTIQPRASLLLNDETLVQLYFAPGREPAQQPVRTYAGMPGRADVALDAMRGLVVHLDEWTVFVQADVLSERERELVARHLDGYTTKDGFPVLTPNGPLAFHRPKPEPTTGVQLAKSALNIDESLNPMELQYTDGDDFFVTIVVTPGPCPTELQKPYVSGNYGAEERCTENDFGRIAVEGNAGLLGRLIEELRVERYRAGVTTTSA